MNVALMSRRNIWMRKVLVISLNVDLDGILEHYKIGFHSRSFD